MEFFREVDVPREAVEIQRMLTIEALPRYCEEIDEVLRDEGVAGEIDCIWGIFEIHRASIRGGVRFTLPTCPNAFTWSVTSGLDPDPEQTVVHCTINRRTHDPDFIETIEMFVDAWAAGLS